MDTATPLHLAEFPTDKCHLLTIPPEVRDSILKYLLISPKPLAHRTVRDDHPVSADENITVPLAIACTCKQLLWETVPIYYAKNSFDFQDFNSLHQFLRNIGPGRRPFVKDITIALHHVREFGPRGEITKTRNLPSKAMKFLGQCGPLNKLTVTLFAYRSHGHTNRYFRTPGVSRLRDIKGCKTLRVNWDYRFLGGAPLGGRMREQRSEFERVLKDELYAEAETETEKKARIIAEKKQERDDRRASLRPRV